jgi:hypothetical protein
MYEDRFGYEEKIPDTIREIFMWLCQEVVSLQDKWRFYQELFGSDENAALLSDLAIHSFEIIEEALRNDMTMSISRLSDPPKSIGKDNLSLMTLIVQCDKADSSIASLKDDFLKACKPIRLNRIKLVAHRDLKTTLKPDENPLLGIGRSTIDEIIRLACEILGTIHKQYVNNTGLAFQPPLARGGAEDLIFWLKNGKEYHDKGRPHL